MLCSRPSTHCHVVVASAVTFAVLFHALDPSAPTGRRIVARGSVQAAVDQAQPGDVVVVPPGVYRESLLVTRRVCSSGSKAMEWVTNPRRVPASLPKRSEAAAHANGPRQTFTTPQRVRRSEGCPVP